MIYRSIDIIYIYNINWFILNTYMYTNTYKVYFKKYNCKRYTIFKTIYNTHTHCIR